MKKPNRDLLVLVKGVKRTGSIEDELMQLNTMLIDSETVENLSIAHEIFDLNRYKIFKTPGKVAGFLSKNSLKPFIFILNKN